METKTKNIYNSWKVEVTDSPKLYSSIISIRDLLKPSKGVLHNVILYDKDSYDKGKPFSSTAAISKLEDSLISISPVYFPEKSYRRMTEVNITLTNRESATPETIKINNFYVHNKEDAIYPSNILDFFNVVPVAPDNNPSIFFKGFFQNSTLNYKFKDDFSGDGISKDDLFEVSIGLESSTSSKKDIILDSKDDIFSSESLLEKNKEAYNTIKINPDRDRIIKFILCYLIYNSDVSGINNNNIKNFVNEENYNPVNTLIEKSKDEKDPTKDILNYMYVWVVAPYAADYIKPSDFDQKLNKDSNVIHDNIILSKDGNFNRYKIEENLEKEESISQVYMPKNSPIKDFLNKKLFSTTITSGSLKNFGNLDNPSEFVEDRNLNLINFLRANDENNVFIDKTYSIYHKDNTYKSLKNYFDPEFYVSTSDDGLGRTQTLIGKYGNIVTDGRIMSPTIDELWYVIKKLISGQKKSYTDNVEQFGEPYNANNQDDTTLFEAINDQFKVKRSDTILKEGEDRITIDPINYNDELQISEWVTQPEKTTLYSYKNETDISRKITNFYREIIPENSDRDIDSIFNANKITGIFSKVNADETYGPRKSAPLSLRELEAAILGNKANIDLNTLFNSKTYAVTGMFGKREDELISGSSTDRQIISGGSLYQLHRDYNAEVDNPNTWFKQNEEIIIEGNEFKYKFIHKGLGILKLFLGEEFDNLFSSIESPLFGYKKDCFYQDNGELLLFSKNGTFKNGEMKVAEISVQGATFYKLNIDLDGTGTFITDDGSTIDILYNLTSFDAEFGDTKAKGEDRDKFILDKDNTPKTDESDQQIFHNSAMPLMVEKYGTSTLLKEEQSEYTGAEVFLAADGTWRRINEHVRIPVLRSKY